MKRTGISSTWLVVAACFLANTTMSLTFSSFGVFFKPVATQFGWDRGMTSSAFTLFLVGYAVSAFVSGRLADRYSARAILLVSAIIAGAGLALSGTVNSINTLRLYSFIGGLGAGATQSIPTSSVQRWFKGKKGAAVALSIVVSGAGIGSLIYPVAMTRLILAYGWREAYTIVGLMFFVIVAVAGLTIRRNPEATAASPAGSPGGATAWTAKRVLPTATYIGIFWAFCVGATVTQILQSQLVPHATDAGMSATAAATVLGLTGGISVIGRLGLSPLTDRLGWQKTLAVSFLGMFAGLVWLCFISQTWMLYGFAFLFGAFNGVRVVALYGLLTERFGLHSVGELVGLSSGGSMLVAAMSPYLAGYLFDLTGSYFWTFSLLAALSLSGAIVIQSLRKRAAVPEKRMASQTS